MRNLLTAVTSRSGRHRRLLTAIDARAKRMQTGDYGFNVYSQDVREALVAAVLTNWPVNQSRFDRLRAREAKMRDKVVAALRRDAVLDSDWIIWGRDYHLPWRPWYVLEAEQAWSRGSLDIAVVDRRVVNRDTTRGLRCWAAISIAGEVVRVAASRLNEQSDGPHTAQIAMRDNALMSLTRNAVTLADAYNELSETPRDMSAVTARDVVAARIRQRPTLDADWNAILDQLCEIMDLCAIAEPNLNVR